MNLTQTPDSEFIRRLTEIVLQNLEDENFGVDELISRSGLGKNILCHRLKILTRQTISQFIHEIRLSKSRELLQENAMTVSEVAWKTGFGSPEYFIRCFHEFYGYSPGEVKKRIRNEELSNHSIIASPIQEPGQEKINTIQPEKPIRRSILNLLAGMLILIVFGILVYGAFSGNAGFMRFITQKKSIAVLPFTNDSPETLDDHFIKGITDMISNDLTNISDIYVVPRSSTELYQGNNIKSTQKIKKKLKAQFWVEGSAQKTGDSVLIMVQLIDARNSIQLCARNYMRKYDKVFNLYEEIAQDVATLIKANVMSAEKEKISNPPSGRSAAMIAYLRSVEIHQRGDLYPIEKPHYDSLAEIDLNHAIELDSTVSDFYIDLAAIYKNRNKKDTALWFIQKAYRFDKYNSRLYANWGMILDKNKFAERERLFKRSIELNPNNSVPYCNLGQIYFCQGNYSKGLEYLCKSLQIIGPPELGYLNTEIQKYEHYSYLFYSYLFYLGFIDEGKKYADILVSIKKEAYPLFVTNLMGAKMNTGKYIEAYDFCIQNAAFEKEIPYYDYKMVFCLLYLRKYQEVIEYFKKNSNTDFKNMVDDQYWTYALGYALWQVGQNEEAEHCFSKAIMSCKERIKKIENSVVYDTMNGYPVNPYIILTCIFAVKKDRQKALQFLREDRKYHPMHDLRGLSFLKNFPMLDNIRNEPEFQAYLNEAETKFQSERREVEKLLIKEGILGQK